jgi:hypothetical protein
MQTIEVVYSPVCEASARAKSDHGKKDRQGLTACNRRSRGMNLRQI